MFPGIVVFDIFLCEVGFGRPRSSADRKSRPEPQHKRSAWPTRDSDSPTVNQSIPHISGLQRTFPGKANLIVRWAETLDKTLNNSRRGEGRPNFWMFSLVGSPDIVVHRSSSHSSGNCAEVPRVNPFQNDACQDGRRQTVQPVRLHAGCLSSPGNCRR